MKALVSPIELCRNGYRIAQVEQQQFEVAAPFFWVDCDESVRADMYYYDPLAKQIFEIPGPPALSHAEQVEGTLEKARALRLPIMQILDGMQASAIYTGATIMIEQQPVALAGVIEDCKQALKDLPATVDLSQCTSQQQMEMVVLQAYQAIVLAAPPEIKSAFDSLKP